MASADDVDAWAGMNGRTDGAQEYGGRIQVPDLGALEPWVKGKPEFKYFVYSHTGTLIKERAFGKWRRSAFGGGAWVYMKDFIGTWYSAEWGPSTYERWLEEDGGPTSAYTQTISYVQNGTTFSTTITTPARNRDDDMGYANIHFTDMTYNLVSNPQNGTIYNFNYMNMFRSHSIH